MKQKAEKKRLKKKVAGGRKEWEFRGVGGAKEGSFARTGKDSGWPAVSGSSCQGAPRGSETGGSSRGQVVQQF